MNTKDLSAIRYILNYCEQIEETKKEFADSKTSFTESSTFRNAVCLCLLQIGELVTVLSDEFKENQPEIQWRDIKLLRNIVAHKYGKIDYDIIWDICLSDVPELMNFCIRILNDGGFK